MTGKTAKGAPLIKKILVPVDGSEPADMAVALASDGRA